MKMRVYRLSYTKTFDVDVLAPVDCTWDAVLEIGRGQITRKWHQLDDVAWRVGERSDAVVEVEDTHRLVDEFSTVHGIKFVDFRLDNSALMDALVVNDAADAFVPALQASWWRLR
jgi:hypothetical protein